MPDFAEFFTTATGHLGGPPPYQERIAGTTFEDIPDTLILPTGSGRTETILSLWLWRIYSKEPGIPRRLVYCLPSGALTEHTAIKVKKWLWNLKLNRKVDIRFLAGGSEGYMSNINLGRECIIVGTQEVLLSGALNHMYGQRPGIWPIASALLNNDSMWVMDEARTMGAGLGTSLQLDAFRRACGTFGPSRSVWISAVKGPLGTKDNPEKNRRVLSIEDPAGDGARIRRIDLPTRDGRYTDTDAKKLLDLRGGGSMAVILNSVDRAQRLYSAVKGVQGQMRCVLVHPRFRADDRARLSREIHGINEDTNVVVISTQALESGTDLSVQTLVTELAPWPAMVNRIGRCRGADSSAYWIDIDGPYRPHNPVYDEMGGSRKVLEEIEGRAVPASTLPVSPGTDDIHGAISLQEVKKLYDTTQDIGGDPVDVSRFVGDDNPEALVFWSREGRRSRWNELCGMELGELRRFVSGHRGMCTCWDSKTMKWAEMGDDDAYPGMIARIEPSAGGYSQEMGLYTGYRGPVGEVFPQARQDRRSGRDVTLREHTQDVVDEADWILSGLGVGAEYSNAVRTAAQWHDVGKMHRIFQEFLGPNVEGTSDEIWAKSGRKEYDKDAKDRRDYERHGFRHEVASAMAFTAVHDGEEHDLAAYLVMSHHGIVRVVLRGPADVPGDMIAGVVHGEALSDRGYSVHEGVTVPAGIILDTSISGKGERRPWSARTSSLLDGHGPFRLSYLESILRKADWAASAKEDLAPDGKR
ncbi:helicase [Cenarchaeum symbiosum A]|uniref:Helicase n=1 Tax=Cenarchaeum symbiosum (strain A) TaxID=414004 RepID=A0RTX0_CENSY|nr:helicase [Cenarchaeum symbiosum A]